MLPVFKFGVAESAFPESAKTSHVRGFAAGDVATKEEAGAVFGFGDDEKNRWNLCAAKLSDYFSALTPNQALVPTTTAVTRRADARHAPAAVAAHL